MSDAYRKYLKSIANQNKTSFKLIDSWVFEAVGKRVQTIKRVISGEANEVYLVRLDEDGELIVRIGRSDGPVFDQEKWAIEQCARVGVPVPECLLIKHLAEGKTILSVCIQTKLPGDTMERGKIDYWDMPDEKVKVLLHEAGSVLSKIHSIKVVGFGSLDKDGKGEFGSFTEMVMDKPNQLASYLEMARELKLPAGRIKKALDFVAMNGEKITGIQPVLNHGDFAGKHIMYIGTKVSGIIDFGEVLGHSPVFDFARWEYWFGNDKYYTWLKEGYENKSIFGGGFGELSHLIQLDMSLGTTWWYYKQKYDAGIKRAINKMNELLDRY